MHPALRFALVVIIGSAIYVAVQFILRLVFPKISQDVADMISIGFGVSFALPLSSEMRFKRRRTKLPSDVGSE